MLLVGELFRVEFILWSCDFVVLVVFVGTEGKDSGLESFVSTVVILVAELTVLTVGGVGDDTEPFVRDALAVCVADCAVLANCE